MEEIILQYLPTGLTAIVSLVIGVVTKMLAKKVTELTTATKDQKNKELKELADRVDILVSQNNALIEEQKKLKYQITKVKED